MTFLRDYYGNFKSALNNQNDELKTHPKTVDDIERELKAELEKAKKPGG